jgi:hypothetical protein
MNDKFKPLIHHYSVEYLLNLTQSELIQIIINLQNNR